MTAVAQAPAPAPGYGPGTTTTAPPTLATPASSGSVTTRALRMFATWDTPLRLRVAMVVSVLASLTVAGFGWQAGTTQASALSAASADGNRVVSVESVRNDLVAADAIVTNAFLVGGLEPQASRTQYDTLIDQAARTLSAVSSSTQADADQREQATAALATYTGLVEQARAANRQGLPVGSAYLAQASTLLRSDLLPALDTLTLSGADQVAKDYQRVGTAPWLLLLVTSGLAVLGAIHRWDSRRTHRRFNVGLSTATALVAVALFGATSLIGVAAHASDVRVSDYRTSLAVSQALSQAYDARAMESFTLIARGSGTSYEVSYQEAAAEAMRQLDRVTDSSTTTTASRFSTWTNAHEQIRALDDGGDWDAAVELAVSTADDSPAAAFTTFTNDAAQVLDEAQQSTTTDLAHAGQTARWIAGVLAVVGLVAAGASWWGLSRRLEEYR